MIFFAGLGFLVAPVVVVGFLTPIFLEFWLRKEFGVSLPNGVVMTAASILPFIGLLTLDFLLKKYGPTRKAMDRRTGKEVEIDQSHSFMFLPVSWCAFIWIGLAICIGIAVIFSWNADRFPHLQPKAISRFVVEVLPYLFLIWAIRISRRPEVNRKCAWSLILMLAMWIFLDPLISLNGFPNLRVIAALGILSVIITVCVASIMAILGLAECHKQRTSQVKGRIQACFALLIMGVFMWLFGGGR